MTNAINWFEIATTDLNRAQQFYEAILDCKMQQINMGNGIEAVFPYEQGQGVGGSLTSSKQGLVGTGGAVMYLNAGTSLDAALERVEAAGGKIVLPRQDLPPGIGFYAHIMDTEGNRVGLHAMA
jgi:predicted enzyme related to lactoylglutathione lyase